MELSLVGGNIRTFLMILFLTQALSSEAGAYPTPVDFDGTLTGWPLTIDDGLVTYETVAELPTDGDQFGPVIDEAAALWSYAGGSFVAYRKAEDGETAKVTVKLVRTLKDGAYASGYTTFDEHDKEGRPTHCTISVHVSDSYSYNGIAKTILHELGHGLGLGHTLIPEAIMSYSLSKNKFALDIDDEAALARLYPPDGTKPRLAPGCAVGSPKAMSPFAEEVDIRLALICFPLLLAILIGLQPMASIRSMDRFARRRISSGT